MITQRTFIPDDIEVMELVVPITDAIVKDLLLSPCAWTILSGDMPVCIWGKIHIWNGRAIIWSIMGEGSRTCMRGIVKHSRLTLDKMEETRIEATVKRGFRSGCRLIEMLGFKRECIMEKFSANGDDEYLYSRVA